MRSLHSSQDGQLAPLLKSLQSNVAPLKRCPMAKTTRMCISCKATSRPLHKLHLSCHTPFHIGSHMRTLTWWLLSQ